MKNCGTLILDMNDRTNTILNERFLSSSRNFYAPPPPPPPLHNAFLLISIEMFHIFQVSHFSYFAYYFQFQTFQTVTLPIFLLFFP